MKLVPLKALGSIYTGNTPSKKERKFYEAKDIPFIKPDIISDSKLSEITHTEEYISNLARNNARIIPKNSILVTCIGSIGKIGITGPGEYAFNQQINAIVPNDGINVRYLAYCLLFNKKKLCEIANNAVVPIINKKQFSDFCVIINPDIKVQKDIVRTLDILACIIKQTQSHLAKLDELAKCRFVEMFGNPLDPKAKWKTTTFGSEFEIFSGGTPSTSVSEYWDNGTIPWIGSNMCQDVILSSTDGKYITEEGFNKSSAKWAHAGYVIVALVGATIGKTALLTISTTTNQNVASVNVPGNTNYTPEYVYMLMRFLYAKFMELGNGGFKMANLGFIRQLPLPSPPIDLQREYSDFVHRIDKLRMGVQAALDKAQTLFDSLMQEYFG